MSTSLGVGIGWRAEIDQTVERLPGIEFVEVIADEIVMQRIPLSLRILRERGLAIIPRSMRLSLGGAERPDPDRLVQLAACADRLRAPMVSGRLPDPLTSARLELMIDDVLTAQRALPVPVAVAGVVSGVGRPGAQLAEAELLATLIGETGALLLLDLGSLHANAVTLGWDPIAVLDVLPLDRIGYVRIPGAAHDRQADAWQLLAHLARRVPLPGVLLDRDASFPPSRELSAELAQLRGCLQRGNDRIRVAVG